MHIGVPTRPVAETILNGLADMDKLYLQYACAALGESDSVSEFSDQDNAYAKMCFLVTLSYMISLGVPLSSDTHALSQQLFSELKTPEEEVESMGRDHHEIRQGSFPVEGLDPSVVAIGGVLRYIREHAQTLPHYYLSYVSLPYSVLGAGARGRYLILGTSPSDGQPDQPILWEITDNEAGDPSLTLLYDYDYAGSDKILAQLVMFMEKMAEAESGMIPDTMRLRRIE